MYIDKPDLTLLKRIMRQILVMHGYYELLKFENDYTILYWRNIVHCIVRKVKLRETLYRQIIICYFMKCGKFFLLVRVA